MMSRYLITRLMAGAAMAGFAAQGIAAEWQPTKPIRMLVGFAPGGPVPAQAAE